MTHDNVTTDPNSGTKFEDARQAVSGAADQVGAPGPKTGLDDIDGLLGEHSDKTKDKLKDSAKTLGQSAKGVDDITDGDEESSNKFKPAALGSGVAPPASPAPAAAPAPVSAPTAMPAPTPGTSVMPAGMRPIAPQALAALLSNAGVTPEAADAAAHHHRGSGAKAALADLKRARSGAGAASPAQLAADIDKACDANGIPDDKKTRAKWHALYRFLIEKESGNNPDAIQGVKDVNWSGATASDGAPENAARGYCQLTPGTFKSFHVAGTSDNIFDRVANVAASQRYIIEHYGVEPTAGTNFDRFVEHRHANGYTGY
ncbi:transglycosylase SLT domain-containing protein [Mycobacterium intracellulare]|uniref:Transglycosylase n=1 Tax=Mycobacterium intracellulare subsp. chimaera TaxID=222805 RepID=A0A7U5MRF8_MYCIT|nr:transglycosylase SLT domain-containing protein [Mycobacterium intracellulare]ASL18344.1 transglycosylase [Mycobacterium intracellulare subsp. chimaera]